MAESLWPRYVVDVIEDAKARNQPERAATWQAYFDTHYCREHRRGKEHCIPGYWEMVRAGDERDVEQRGGPSCCQAVTGHRHPDDRD